MHRYIVQGEDLSVQQAYLTAAYLGPNKTLPGVDPICSSGDCAWPTYGSLGVCVEIVNLSATTNTTLLDWLDVVFVLRVETSDYGSAFDLVASQKIEGYAAALVPAPVPISATEFKETQFQTVIGQFFLAYFHEPIQLTTADLAKAQYIGISMYLCTQSFSTTVKDGIQNTSEIAYTADIVSKSTEESTNSAWNGALNGNATDVCEAGKSGDTITLASPMGSSNETYAIDFCTASYLSELFVIGTSGAIFLGLDHKVVESVGQISEAMGTALYGEFNSSMIPDPSTQFENVRYLMDNIAKSLTNYLRNEGMTYLNQDNATVVGTAYALQTFVKIRWIYLLFIMIQLGLTIIILFFTIFATYRSKIQILKGNHWANMYILSEEVKNMLGDVGNMEQVAKKARDIDVKLKIDGDGNIKGFETGSQQ
ncbi:hypothetical protein H072_492 [Dactylellina haptotyla CBS 200.50]|uniref:Uncharacterized protein n=1 Tax=Dactylellina haptotyla (strain CBS 200.50) TaxID=1284197 RepID=S8AR96_DACHA|nr:hypothetical protein H072_492 [Dactylellina haptotyla CBS 200.50]